MTKFPQLSACVVEPNQELITEYQDKVGRRDANLDGVKFEWQNQTFKEYLNSRGNEQKFHFISVVNTIHFLGDPETTGKLIKDMHDLLQPGGIIFLVVTTGE